ncbi:MAG TPA: hypothetical protein VIW21_00425 [Chthoniobacterales bacterium]|jgi:hypothetical protein
MRDLLLFLLLGVVAYLGYDDYSKRNALKAAQEEVQRVNADRADRSQADQTPVRQRPLYARPYAPAAASPPAWFQERLNERPSLDEPVRHRQSDQDGTGRRSSTYGSSPTPP